RGAAGLRSRASCGAGTRRRPATVRPADVHGDACAARRPPAVGHRRSVLGALIGMPTLRIGHLYPDLLNLYGDRGNIMVLARRALGRGFEVTVREVGRGEPVDPESADLFFIGGGEDRQQRIAAEDLSRIKRRPLEDAAAAGAVILAVCGGYQL